MWIKYHRKEVLKSRSEQLKPKDVLGFSIFLQITFSLVHYLIRLQCYLLMPQQANKRNWFLARKYRRMSSLSMDFWQLFQEIGNTAGYVIACPFLAWTLKIIISINSSFSRGFILASRCYGTLITSLELIYMFRYIAWLTLLKKFFFIILTNL